MISRMVRGSYGSRSPSWTMTDGRFELLLRRRRFTAEFKVELAALGPDVFSGWPLSFFDLMPKNDFIALFIVEMMLLDYLLKKKGLRIGTLAGSEV